VIRSEMLPDPIERIVLDDRICGVPPGTAGLDSSEIHRKAWHPTKGQMPLPVLTLDEAAFITNRDIMMNYVRTNGIDIAPHAKTPLSPDLARNLLDAGAWATTVADVRQACVMARAGLGRLILASETGGNNGARRLAEFASAFPDTSIYVFADSVAGVTALSETWGARRLPPLAVLVDVGSGRSGTRTSAEAVAIADAILSSGGRLQLAGVGSYEGNAIQTDPAETERVMEELITRIAGAFAYVRRQVGDRSDLILTAGGSLFFELMVSFLAPLVRQDGNARLVLRSGAIFFYDHGICHRFLGSRVRGDMPFKPALRLWADVLSRPEPGLAICGLGMRDVSFDQGFPAVIQLHRDGVPLPQVAPLPGVTKLNDQHCFLAVPESCDIAVGDVVELGVTHACTSIDRHRVIYGLDSHGYVRHAFPTYFG
jgi:D-serine dehydratase